MNLDEALTILGTLHDELPAGCGGMMVPVEIVETILVVAAVAETEYGAEMTNGGMQTRPTDKFVQRLYPLSKWIEDKQERGGRVHKRKIIILESWKLLKKGALN